MPENQDYSQWAAQQIRRLPTELRVSPRRDSISIQDSVNRDTADIETVDREKVNFFSTLPLDAWKQELDKLREEGDLEALEKREIEIVHLIKQRLFELPYDEDVATPDKIISCGAKNCAGASILGSICIEQLGIDHRILASDYHKLQHASNRTLISDEKRAHAFILVLGSNGHVFWSEMTNDCCPFMVNDEDMTVKSAADQSSSLYDGLKTAVNFARCNIKVIFSFLSTYKERSLRELAGDATEIFTIEPELGRKALLLMWHARELRENGKNEEAVQVYQAQVDMGLETPFILVRLSEYQVKNGDRKAALETLEKLRNFPSIRSDDILKLGQCYIDLGRPEDYEALLEEYMIKNEDYDLCKMLTESLFSQKRWHELLKIQLKFISKIRPADKEVYVDLLDLKIIFERRSEYRITNPLWKELIRAIKAYLLTDSRNGLQAFRNVRSVLDSFNFEGLVPVA